MLSCQWHGPSMLSPGSFEHQPDSNNHRYGHFELHNVESAHSFYNFAFHGCHAKDLPHLLGNGPVSTTEADQKQVPQNPLEVCTAASGMFPFMFFNMDSCFAALLGFKLNYACAEVLVFWSRLQGRCLREEWGIRGASSLRLWLRQATRRLSKTEPTFDNLKKNNQTQIQTTTVNQSASQRPNSWLKRLPDRGWPSLSARLGRSWTLWSSPFAALVAFGILRTMRDLNKLNISISW